jgi:hypothetical protein
MKRYLLLAMLTFGLINGYCQQMTTASTNHNVALNLSNAIEITFTRGQDVSFNFTTASHYQSGLSSFNAATIRIRSNKRYTITVKSATSHFASNSATPMPVSGVLGVSFNNSITFRDLSTTDINFITNQNRGVRTFNLNYRATPGFNYDAGTYTANIIYTATQL